MSEICRRFSDKTRRRVKGTAFVYRVPWDMIKIWRLLYRNEVERFGLMIHDGFVFLAVAARGQYRLDIFAARLRASLLVELGPRFFGHCHSLRNAGPALARSGLATRSFALAAVGGGLAHH